MTKVFVALSSRQVAPQLMTPSSNGFLMMHFSDPDILDGLGYAIVAVGLAGLIALTISDADRRLPKPLLGVVLATMTVSGVGLIWKAETVRHADRDLSPARQADLSRAIAQFPTITFEVYALRTDKEAYSLAVKIADAVEAAKGTPPAEGAAPSAPIGVVLLMRNPETDLARAITRNVGRAFLAARIAVERGSMPELDDDTVRIVVGPKP